MNKNNKYLSLSIILTLVACFIAVIMRLFSQTDLYFQIFAAILGVIITAIITQVLLRGQTENDAMKEKDTKVFEEKLKIYKEFLCCLCKVIKDGEVIKKEDALELEFQTSYITMHTKSEQIKVIAQQVKTIVDIPNSQSDSDNPAEKASKNNKILMQCLFKIVNEFRKELYQSNPTEEDKLNMEEAVKAFTSIFEAFEAEQPNTFENTNANDTGKPIDIIQNREAFAKELLTKIGLDYKLWEVKTNMDPAIYINIAKQDNKEGVRIVLNQENAEQFLQVHLDHADTYGAYQHMRWRFGGRQNRVCWWRWLDSPMRNFASSNYIKNRDWNFLVENISKQMKALVVYVENFERIRNEIYQHAPKDKANVWIYYETIVAFDYEKTLGSDKFFMDVERCDNHLYTISFGNRDEDENNLIARVKAIGFNITNESIKSKHYTAYSNLTAEEAVARIKEIDNKVNNSAD